MYIYIYLFIYYPNRLLKFGLSQKEIHRQMIHTFLLIHDHSLEVTLVFERPFHQLNDPTTGHRYCELLGIVLNEPKVTCLMQNHLNCNIWECICNLCNLNWMLLPFCRTNCVSQFLLRQCISMHFPRFRPKKKRQDHKKVVIHLTRRRKRRLVWTLGIPNGCIVGFPWLVGATMTGSSKFGETD